VSASTTSEFMTTLVWFRQDLRLADNPALSAALATGEAVVPVYIHAPGEEGIWRPGAASRWWLHGSLARLDEDLKERGSRLCLRLATDSLAELLNLARECGAGRVLWNRRYEPAVIARDRQILAGLRDAGLEARSYNSALLHEPWEVENRSGAPFQVFTPFWRQCLSMADPAEPLPAPSAVPAPRVWPRSVNLAELALLPRIDWAAGMRESWTPGSASAHRRLNVFLDEAFGGYSGSRNRPDLSGTSRLSPHLHFGEIGPREIWHAARRHAESEAADWRGSQFLAEVGWREFAHHLLFHFPQTPTEPLRAGYARFPWRSDPAALDAWQRGMTGFPIVDAGMRELWHTGWMHNRVRMIAASFLVKDLLVSWQDGARWFWDTLVDADLASNTLGWQWVAGCGADAAPYFRIFNPGTQGIRFDPDGAYVRRWVPELAKLEAAFIHEPWSAPPAVLQAAAVRLGETYPNRMVDHAAARQAALAALATLKN
jgi:deoxyribodipyrimidine photo-lyase